MPYFRMKNYRITGLARKYQPLLIGTSVLLISALVWPTFLTAQEAAPVVAAVAKDVPKSESVGGAPPPNANPEALVDNETENADVTKALEDLLRAMKLGEFSYQVEERPDPFMPFISDKVVNPAETDSETGERLTGMRQFEPGQLNLVAIMFTETNPMAMVEDSSHKGYLVRRGTKVGKTGVVTDILPNEVVIKQLSYSMDQAAKYTTMEMILRKEGEK